MQANGPGSSPRLFDLLLWTMPDVTVDFPPGVIFQMHATSRCPKELTSPFNSDARVVHVTHVADERLLTLKKEWEDRKKAKWESLRQFVQPENGSRTSEKTDFVQSMSFCAIFRDQGIKDFPHEEVFWGK